MDFNFVMNFVALAKIAIATVKLTFWIVRQTAQNVNLAVLFQQEVADIINPK